MIEACKTAQQRLLGLAAGGAPVLAAGCAHHLPLVGTEPSREACEHPLVQLAKNDIEMVVPWESSQPMASRQNHRVPRKMATPSCVRTLTAAA